MPNTPGAAGRWWMPLPLLALLLAALWTLDWNLPWFLALNAAAAGLPERFWSLATVLGDAVVVVALILPWLKRDPETARALAIALLIALVLVPTLKDFYGHARPAGVLAPELYHAIGPRHVAGSFPSGHTTTAGIFFSVLLLRGVGAGRLWLRLGLVAALVLTGASRIAVGIHWPVDVVAGWLLAWALAWIGVRIAATTRFLAWSWSLWGLALFCVAAAAALVGGFDGHYPLANPFLRLLGAALLLQALWDWRAEGMTFWSRRR